MARLLPLVAPGRGEVKAAYLWGVGWAEGAELPRALKKV